MLNVLLLGEILPIITSYYFASLFFTSWVKDARAVIVERLMTTYESLQLVKDYTKGKACAQVEFYLVSTPNPTLKG